MPARNPILEAMTGNRQNGGNSGIANLVQIVKGNPDGMFQMLLQTNPEFAKFVQANKGKTPEQIASEYGIDINTVRQFMK